VDVVRDVLDKSVIDRNGREMAIKRPTGYIARWDQLNLSNPDRPTLTCAAESLQRR
jgi:hypothetical protein